MVGSQTVNIDIIFTVWGEGHQGDPIVFTVMRLETRSGTSVEYLWHPATCMSYYCSAQPPSARPAKLKLHPTHHTDLTQISVLRCSTKERRLKLCTETFWVELEWRIYHGEIIMGMNLSSTILSANKIGIYFSRSNDSLAPLHSTWRLNDQAEIKIEFKMNQKTDRAIYESQQTASALGQP